MVTEETKELADVEENKVESNSENVEEDNPNLLLGDIDDTIKEVAEDEVDEEVDVNIDTGATTA